MLNYAKNISTEVSVTLEELASNGEPTPWVRQDLWIDWITFKVGVDYQGYEAEVRYTRNGDGNPASGGFAEFTQILEIEDVGLVSWGNKVDMANEEALTIYRTTAKEVKAEALGFLEANEELWDKEEEAEEAICEYLGRFED